MNDVVIYEHPLNEIIRACLRMEQLFQQIDHQLKDGSISGTRNVIATIISLLQILDRPDLKSKLAKELNQQHSILSRSNTISNIDPDTVKKFINETEFYSRLLIDSSGKIGQRVREIELLSALRLHLATPGGGSSFDVPIYHYWLQQPSNLRLQVIHDWLSDFEQIRAIIWLVLDLVRRSGSVQEKKATHGFYQEMLDAQSNLRMIQIQIARDLATYPEVSLGRHFLSVRFFIPDIEKRPVQDTEDLSFLITYCGF